MFNGIWPERTNKRFNSAYLQYKFLICRKIPSNTFWLYKTCSCWSQFNLMFKKKDFKKIQKKWSQILNWGLPRQARQAKKTSSSWKFIEFTDSRRSGRGHRSGVMIILLKLFFFKNSWSCPQTYLGAGRRRKSPLDGAIDFLKNLTAHYNTQFCISFHFGFDQEAQNASKRVWIGSKHNSVHFSLTLQISMTSLIPAEYHVLRDE